MVDVNRNNIPILYATTDADVVAPSALPEEIDEETSNN